MSYRVAGVDVHKRMIAVVVADVEGDGEYQFERRRFAATPHELHLLAQWLTQQEVQEAVMESTAQYWKPVWGALERYWKPDCQKREGAGPMSGTLHLAQAKSNRGPRGRKNDYADAQRLVKRLVAQELTLSFVPEPEQRLWRTISHKKYQLTQQVGRVQNQLEAQLEEAHIKLSSMITDLLGVSGRRMLQALAEGETEPAKLASLADHRLRATPEQLRDALGAVTDLNPIYRRLVRMALEQLRLLEYQIEELDKESARLLSAHQNAVERVAEVPGFGVDSSQQVIAEMGPQAAPFPTAKNFSSWVGTCPGQEESAGESKSSRSPKGNRNLRRILNQAAQSAVKVKGSIFELKFRQLVPRLGYKAAIWAIAHRLGRLVWKILHDGVRYEERGPAVSAKSTKARTSRMIKQLRALGYQVVPLNLQAAAAR